MPRRRSVSGVRRVMTALAAVGVGAAFAVTQAPAPAVAAGGAGAVSAACPWVGSSAPISQRVSQVLAKMTVTQKVDLVTGASGSSYVGFIPAIGSLCIPAVNLEDGPAGVGDGMSGVTQLPAPVDIAATWDTSAEQTYGRVIGAEQAAKGTTVDLGPTINIVRDPRWGRAFESVSEDPYLAGAMGAADIRGVQSTGTMAQVKHLAVYNQETNRNTPADNAVVSTQAEQEIYLPAFGQAVQQGAASSVMCSYSTVNGTYACQNPYLLTVTAADSSGALASTSFTWTVLPSGDDIPTTPLVGYQGLCLDVSGDNNTPGSKVEIYTCNGTDGQQWTEESNGTVRADGDCLDVVGGGTANGTLVDLYTCNGTGAQVWQPQSDGALVNPQSGKCLDDTGFSTSPGTQVQIWSCTGNSNQSWVSPAG